MSTIQRRGGGKRSIDCRTDDQIFHRMAVLEPANGQRARGNCFPPQSMIANSVHAPKSRGLLVGVVLQGVNGNFVGSLLGKRRKIVAADAVA